MNNKLPSGTDRPVIGINPMPYRDDRYWPDQDRNRYQDYIGKFAQFSSALIRNGYQAFFFPTQKMNPLVIDDIISIMDADILDNIDTKSLIKNCHTVDQLIKLINQATMVIAKRFHGVLLSLYSAIPTVAICYGKKTDELMRECGQGGYSHTLEKFNADAIVEIVGNLAAELPRVADVLKKKRSDNALALGEQYYELNRP